MFPLLNGGDLCFAWLTRCPFGASPLLRGGHVLFAFWSRYDVTGPSVLPGVRPIAACTVKKNVGDKEQCYITTKKVTTLTN